MINLYQGQASADIFKAKLEHMGIQVYRHYCIEGYPSNIPLIVSDQGLWKKMIISKPAVLWSL